MSAVPQLAAAVSNAGALGMLALTWSTPAGDPVRETAALTDRPFGGNLILISDQHRRLDEALEAGLRIVSLMWGDPAGYVEQVHDASGIVLHTVGSAEEARRAVASGVDVIVAQGWEAGGHVWSQVATLPLVPAVVDAVAPVPVIAAGGIGDARGVAAVLALGRASGVAGYPVSAGRGDAHPRGVSPSSDGRGRDRCAVVPRPVRRRLAGCAPPRPPQLDGRDVGGRGPATTGESTGRGRRHRALRLRRTNRSVRDGARRWSVPPVISKRSHCGPDRASRSPGSRSRRQRSWPRWVSLL